MLLLIFAWKKFRPFSVFTSGRCAHLVTTWTASDWALDYPHTSMTLTRDNAAIHEITAIVMNIAMMKMFVLPLTAWVGVHANSRATTWQAFTKAAAMTLIALKISNAARWRKVNLFILFPLESKITYLLTGNPRSLSDYLGHGPFLCAVLFYKYPTFKGFVGEPNGFALKVIYSYILWIKSTCPIAVLYPVALVLLIIVTQRITRTAKWPARWFGRASSESVHVR